MTTRSEIRTAAAAAAAALAKPGGSVEQLLENAERIEEYIRSGSTVVPELTEPGLLHALGTSNPSAAAVSWPSYDH